MEIWMWMCDHEMVALIFLSDGGWSVTPLSLLPLLSHYLSLSIPLQSHFIFFPYALFLTLSPLFLSLSQNIWVHALQIFIESVKEGFLLSPHFGFCFSFFNLQYTFSHIGSLYSPDNGFRGDQAVKTCKNLKSIFNLTVLCQINLVFCLHSPRYGGA